MFRHARGWSALFFLLIFSASPANIAGQPRRELRVGLTRVPAVLDPATALEGTAAILARQLFDSLLAYRDGSTDVEPALATRWTVSRDGLTWSFVLRDNVRFHDGTPLTAADVVASFNRHLPAESASGARPATAWATLLRGVPGVIKEVRAANPRTVQFALVQPYAALLTVLAHPAFGIVKPTGEGGARLVGTGPYRVVEGASGRITLEANREYWAGAPRAERIVIVDLAGDEQAEAELDAAAVDVWFPPGAPRRPQWAQSVPGLRVGYLAFQTEKEPFSRRKLRQAVAAAIDPPTLGVALGTVAVPLQSFLPPGVWARREGSPILGGSREAVRKLLAEGNWPRGFKPTLVVQVEPGGVDATLIGETLALSMAAADIPVQLRADAAAGGTSRALAAGEHDLALAEARVAGGDPHLLLFPLSTTEGATRGARVQNFSFYRDPRVDDLLVRASQLAYRVERQRLYHRAQAMLAEELPWIPIYVRLEWAVARPEVRGLRLHPTGFHRWQTLTLEPAA